MQVLLIGSGGREHALAWKIAKSSRLTKLYLSPGNPGMNALGEKVELDITDHAAVIDFCVKAHIDLVIAGPEAPLVAGIVNDLTAAGISCFGPTKEAAQLEGSKSFTKALCDQYNIPTAGYAHFEALEPALEYLKQKTAPIVIKADGLAAGKGVTVALTMEEAHSALKDCFDGAFEDAGATVVIEDFLDGEEASFFALVDGQTAQPLGTAQDHKRAYDGDQGPNTGGMGAYSPAPILDEAMCQRVMDDIIMPTVKGMAKNGTPFKGVLYAGLMITETGPQLIEYNVRFGDPECQVLMMRLQSDILELMQATDDQTLDQIEPQWSDQACMTVVLASGGYPGRYEKGYIIQGLDQALPDHQVVFHAGTAERDGDILTNGGRVLNICARAPQLVEAKSAAYDMISNISWPDMMYRTDIGWRAL